MWANVPIVAPSLIFYHFFFFLINQSLAIHVLASILPDLLTWERFSCWICGSRNWRDPLCWAPVGPSQARYNPSPLPTTCYRRNKELTMYCRVNQLNSEPDLMQDHEAFYIYASKFSIIHKIKKWIHVFIITLPLEFVIFNVI